MNSKTTEAMIRLRSASPIPASGLADSMTQGELDELRASVPVSPFAVPKKRRWASLSAPRRTAIVALVVGLVGAGGGLAAATSHSTPTPRGSVFQPFYPEAQRKVIYANLLKLATCMHAHGYPTFPDPQPNYGNGKVPAFMMGGPSGGNIDVLSPGVQAALKECSVGMQKVPGNLRAKAFPPGTR